MKHSYVERIDFISNFLVEHQAMGIYLYRELNSSGRRVFKKLARSIFEKLKPELDSSSVSNIQDLLI